MLVYVSVLWEALAAATEAFIPMAISLRPLLLTDEMEFFRSHSSASTYSSFTCTSGD